MSRKESMASRSGARTQGAGPRRGPMGGPMGGPGAGASSGEKARNFKGTMLKLLSFMGEYKPALVVVLVFAVASTVFNVVGPKVLSEATTELYEGISAKITGTGGIDFSAVGVILITALALYAFSALCSFVQGWLMTHVVPVSYTHLTLPTKKL